MQQHRTMYGVLDPDGKLMEDAEGIVQLFPCGVVPDMLEEGEVAVHVHLSWKDDQ